MNIVKIKKWMSKTQKRKSTLTKCRKLEQKNRHNWLNVDWSRRTKKSTIDCHYRWFTIIFANSRSFSLIHDAHSENEMQSSFSKRKFQIDDFLLTRAFLRMIREFSFDSRISTNDLTIFFWTFAYLYERWKFCFYSFFLRANDDFL